MQIASVFRDVFGDREQLRHRLERLAQIILIQPGDDDALAASRETDADGRQIGVEKLPSSMPMTSVSA
jgi:hypothetical protein